MSRSLQQSFSGPPSSLKTTAAGCPEAHRLSTPGSTSGFAIALAVWPWARYSLTVLQFTRLSHGIRLVSVTVLWGPLFCMLNEVAL